MSNLIPSSALKDKRLALQSKQDVLHRVFEEAKTESGELDLDKVTSLGSNLSTVAKAEKIRAMNDELTDLGKEVESLEAVERASKQTREREEGRGRMHHPEPGDARRDESRPMKSIGRAFVESDQFKRGRESYFNKDIDLDVDVKALFETGAGFAPETIRTGRVVEFAHRPVQVTDIIPMGNTGQASVVYMEETTSTSAAAEIAEGGAYGESALEFTERTAAVRKIATFLPVTDEQLEDVPMVESLIDRRLSFFLRQRLDSQILSGDGTPPNLRGILNTVGIQSQAKGVDPIPDAVYKAMTKVRVTGRAIPGAVIFHPTNWEGVRLLRTADGLYIWGHPSEAGPERIWGLPVVQSDAITLGKALVGDYANFSELALRRGVTVKVSDSHSDYFVNGKQAIRADMRAAFIVYRPAAFVEVTGL